MLSSGSFTTLQQNQNFNYNNIEVKEEEEEELKIKPRTLSGNRIGMKKL